LTSAVAGSAGASLTGIDTVLTFVFVATATTMWVGVNNTSATAVIEVAIASVRELLGTHARQATPADRPTYTSDLALENVSSDSLSWSAPSGDYTIAYRGNAGTVILDAQTLSGATNIMQATKVYQYVAINRPLGSAERRRLVSYLDKIVI
jgi:hypothetical protein